MSLADRTAARLAAIVAALPPAEARTVLQSVLAAIPARRGRPRKKAHRPHRRPRRAPGTVSTPPGDRATPALAGTAAATAITLLARPGGATLAELTAAIRTPDGTPWAPAAIRALMRGPVRRRGYGVRTTAGRTESEHRFHLVMPEKTCSPLVKMPKTRSPAGKKSARVAQEKGD